MNKEQSSQMDAEGYSQTNAPRAREHDEQGQEHNQEGAPTATFETTRPERGVDIDRSPRPDARDDQKVDELAAPDWRSEQPLPSAENALDLDAGREPQGPAPRSRPALDPRGENTPDEMFEDDVRNAQKRARNNQKN